MSGTISVAGLEEFAVLMVRAAGIGFGGRVTIGNSAAVPYARFVHEGTGPHDILPRNAAALYWPGAEHPVKRVHHPGTKPRPYLEDALMAEEGEVVGILQAGVVAAIESGLPFSVALEAAGRIVEAAAKARAPVRTGTLRDDIHTDVYTR